MALSIVQDIVSIPVQFPDDSTDQRSKDIQPKFHHGLLQKHKKKKRKKKKLGCRISLVNRFRNAAGDGGVEKPEGRFFFYPLINYYDTDINIFNGGGSGGIIDPCSSLIGAGAGAISGTQPGSTPVTDNTDEDYDYSDGGDSDNSNNKPGSQAVGGGASNLLSTGASTLGSAITNAPGAVSNVLSSISNGIRPFFQSPNRYFDYYVVRPFNRSITQLVSWI
ncbi:hypothetical protein O3M35_008049 [Rhynocoris fuscipes]|uniref:Uncharacterized protein n=1 Tax=Rhynocoris fuscipes TaxID=488301 RepID=A0AAW1D7S5_9HEMI